jgi:hypothetical protein
MRSESQNSPPMTTPEHDREIERLKAVVVLARNNFPDSTDLEVRAVGKATGSVWISAHVLQSLLDNSPS